jgi:hypothetical protein
MTWDDSGSGPDLVQAVLLLPYPLPPPPPAPSRIPGARAARVGAWVCALPQAHPQVGFAKDLGLWTEWSPVSPSLTRIFPIQPHSLRVDGWESVDQLAVCRLAGPHPPPLYTWSLYVHCTVLYTLTLVLPPLPPPPPPCCASP